MIIQSRISSVERQADGRSYVTEVHEDDTRGELRFVYLAEPDADREAAMAERAAAIEAERL